MSAKTIVWLSAAFSRLLFMDDTLLLFYAMHMGWLFGDEDDMIHDVSKIPLSIDERCILHS